MVPSTVWCWGIGLSFSESVWKWKYFIILRKSERRSIYCFYFEMSTESGYRRHPPLWDEKNYTRFWNVAERNIKSSGCQRKYHLEASFSSLEEIYRQHADLIRWYVFTLWNHSLFFYTNWLDFWPNWCLPSNNLSTEMKNCSFYQRLRRFYSVLNDVKIIALFVSWWLNTY